MTYIGVFKKPNPLLQQALKVSLEDLFSSFVNDALVKGIFSSFSIFIYRQYNTHFYSSSLVDERFRLQAEE